MVQNKITLTLTEPMLKRLELEKERFSYESVQEIIKEVLRDKFFREGPAGDSKRGRPKKLDYDKSLGMKKVFTKDGGEVVEI